MSRPSSINRFKLFIVMLAIAASAGCGRSLIGPDDERDCRDEFEAPDGYRPVCEHVNPIQ